jgi:hypothetical protein
MSLPRLRFKSRGRVCYVNLALQSSRSVFTWTTQPLSTVIFRNRDAADHGLRARDQRLVWSLQVGFVTLALGESRVPICKQLETPMNPCSHLHAIQTVEATSDGCADCERLGSGWVHLRRCTACGRVGCCDSSPNRHATAHFHSTRHPVMQSFEPGESWYWCYVDLVAFELASEALATLARTGR